MVKGMRDPKRIDRILALIGELWKKHPDQRLGQLLFNYTRFGTRVTIPKTKHLVVGVIRDIFHYEDDDIEKDLMSALSQMICSDCKHKNTCEGLGELARCYYNYPDKKYEKVKK